MGKEKYELKDGATIFYDDESDLKVLAGKPVELDADEVTAKTATAIMSGALVKVKMSKQEQPKPGAGDNKK